MTENKPDTEKDDAKPREKASDSDKQKQTKDTEKKAFCFKTFCWRSAFIGAEAMAIILVILAIALGLSVWRLKSGPVDISFTKTYIEAALKDENTGLYGTMEQAALYWPDLNGPLLLGLQNGRIFDKNNKEVLSVDEIGLGISKRYLLIGQIKPTALVVKKPSLVITRSVNNDIDFGFGNAETIVNVEPESDGDQQENLVGQILSSIKDGSEQREGSPLSALETFAIEDARVMVEDYKLEASWFFPDFDIAFSEVEQGLKSDFKITFPSLAEDGSAFIKASVVLDREDNNAKIQGNVQKLDLRVFAGKVDALDILRDQNVIVNASLDGVLNQNFEPEILNVRLSSKQGDISHEVLSDADVPYKDFNTEISYQSAGDKEKLNLGNTNITLGDLTLRVGAEMQTAQSDTGLDGYEGDIQLKIDDTPHAAIEPLWPNFLKGDSSEEWIVEKMSGGTLSDLKAETKISAFQKDGEWDLNVSGLTADFSFSDISMDYRAPLPAVKNAKGGGRFDLDSDVLTINISKAKMGGLDVSKTGLSFTDVAAEGKGAVDMSINLNGPLRSVFEYISLEPIDLKDELDMDVSKVKGQSTLKVEMEFPTKADLAIEEIKMNVSGNVRDGYLPNVLEGLPLSGGPFSVDVNNERYAVKGSGLLGVNPVTFDWFEYLDSKGKAFKHRAKAQITSTPALRDHFGIDLSEFLTGNVPLDLTYKAFSNGKAEIDGQADITPASFFIKSFGYTKPPGQKGQTQFKAFLNNNILNQVNITNAAAAGFKMNSAQISFIGSGDQTQISQAKINNAVIGETIGNSTIDVARNGAMKIILEGPFLDLRPFLGNKEDKAKAYDDPPLVLSIAVDQMRTADDQTVQYAKIYADIDNQGRFNQLELDAIAGKGDVYLRYKPNEKGVRTFRFEADDAGAALKAFDVYDSIRGGKLVIYGEPIDGVYDRNLVGLAQITDFKAVDTPSLARLLSAMSLTGAMNLLNNEELTFSKLEAGFDWLYRREGALLVLKNGRTSGNSLGLTFDGVFDNAVQTVDVSGTIIPLSGINKAIGSIPLVGDILTGGTGAIFAATYSMKGQSTNPKISVNPLSVLAPGILRRILFE